MHFSNECVIIFIIIHYMSDSHLNPSNWNTQPQQQKVFEVLKMCGPRDI